MTTHQEQSHRLRLGPMVSPLPRRRPAKVARETATLDRLSGGRLLLGVGIGSDRFGGELSKTGEQLDDRRRGHGFFPANLEHPDQLAEIVATITGLRPDATRPYDIAVGLPFDADPRPYAAAGATWWLPEFEPGVPLDTVRGVLRDGPADPGGE
jgi:hypothetical protein